MKFSNDGHQISFDYQDNLGGRLTYFPIRNEKTLVIEHLFVNPDLRGQGFAQQLMLAAIRFAKKQGQLIYPLCPYAQAFLKQHPEYHNLVDLQTNDIQAEMEKNNGSK